jgi:hypothetical protein
MSRAALRRSRDREEQHVVLALLVAFFVIPLNNTTPISGISVNSAIPGIHGMGGQYGCMPRSQNAAER